jgi:hypothetical protein
MLDQLVLGQSSLVGQKLSADAAPPSVRYSDFYEVLQALNPNLHPTAMGRELDSFGKEICEYMSTLVTCDWIRSHHNLLLTGLGSHWR